MNLRKEAKGRECMVRIPGCCNGNPETTVLAHLNGGGMGRKRSDLACGAWCCSSCHDAIDGRIRSQHTAEQLRLWHLEGVVRTIETLESEGCISA